MEEPEIPSRIEKELFDPKSLHQLLYDHQSQDFKKSRRNLMVITFIILSVGFLGLDLANVKIFGLSLDEASNKSNISLLGISLIIYWWWMFEFYRSRDKEIHIRHQDIVLRKINLLKNETPKLREDYEYITGRSPDTPIPPDDPINIRSLLQEIKDREYAISLFNELTNLNKSALKLVLDVEKFELYLPRVFAVYSFILLIFWLFF